MVKESHMDPVDHEAETERYRAPALDKGLDILEVLADQDRGLTRAEIVKELGLSPSQIYRMLERLVARGYVCRDEGGDRYRLTIRMFQLASRHPPVRRLVAQAQPLMDDFARESHQSCHLVLPGQGVGTIVAQASPQGHWEFRARIGGMLDLFTTGSGLTLLAFQREERLAETLGQWGLRESGTALERLRPTLAAIRETGHRIEPSSHLVGVTDISVPVRGIGGEAVAALTCAYIEHPADTSPDGRSRALERLFALVAELG